MFRKPRTPARIKRDLDLRVELAIGIAYAQRCSLAYAIIIGFGENWHAALRQRLIELGCDILWSANGEPAPASVGASQ